MDRISMRRMLFALSFGVLTLLVTPGTLHAQSHQPFDCAAFDSWEWAQSAYERDAGPNAVTPPGGICRSLPHGAAPALWTETLPDAVQAATVIGIVDGDTVDVQLLVGDAAGTIERL